MINEFDKFLLMNFDRLSVTDRAKMKTVWDHTKIRVEKRDAKIHDQESIINALKYKISMLELKRSAK